MKEQYEKMHKGVEESKINEKPKVGQIDLPGDMNEWSTEQVRNFVNSRCIIS